MPFANLSDYALSLIEKSDNSAVEYISNTSNGIESYSELVFNISPRLKDTIRQARETFFK